MALNIVVCVKQVVDPETPASAFKIDASGKGVEAVAGIPPVVNGFDENAVEAALKLKEAQGGGQVTVISVGNNFVMDVMKKPLSMGADQMILIEDESVENLDAFATARVLAAAVGKVGEYDIVLCGRQASDWDNAQVPLGLAELLGLPVVTIAQKIDVTDSGIVVEKALSDGHEVLETTLPAVISISNELGEPRYPTLRGIMAASRKAPTIWSVDELGLSSDDLAPKLEIEELYIPESDKQVEIIDGEDEADAGRKLALRLREEKLI